MMQKKLGTGKYLSLAGFHDLAGQEIFVEDHEYLHDSLSLSDYYIAVRSGGGANGWSGGRESGGEARESMRACC